MFKKNYCPECGAVTGWLAGEPCSKRCKSFLSSRAMGVTATNRVVTTREDCLRIIDALDAESQKLAPKSDAHAYLLTIATELRVYKQTLRKLPYEVVPADLLYKVNCLFAKFHTQKEDIETRFEAKQRKKPTDDVTPEEWLQMRPLTDFEKKARESTVHVVNTPRLEVGIDMGIRHGDETVVTAAIVGKAGEKYEVRHLDYQASMTVPNSVFDDEPLRVAEVFKRDMTSLMEKRPGRDVSPVATEIWKERHAFLMQGIEALLRESGVRFEISKRTPNKEDRCIYVCIFPGGMNGVEYIVRTDVDAMLELQKFARALSETMKQASPYAPSKETAVGSRYDERTSKIAVQGKYDAASGAHLDRLAKMIGLERVGRATGKPEDDASLRKRMYAYDFARGGGTHAPIPPEPLTPEQKKARDEFRGARQAGRFAAY